MEKESLRDIRKELSLISATELAELCLRMAKYKKENKELLAYLLFQKDPTAFTQEVKDEVDQSFYGLRRLNAHQNKKVLQKIMRVLNKYKRFSQSKTFETEMLLYVCHSLNKSGLFLGLHTYAGLLLRKTVHKVEKLMENLHEDLRLDYEEELQRVKSESRI